MADIDKLQISISADAKKATQNLDDLIDRLNRVSTALGTVKTDNASNSLMRLSQAMNTFQKVDKRTFTSLSNKLNSIANVNYAGIKGTANSLHNMASALTKISGVSAGTKDMSDLATAMAKLGYKSVTQAITNIPLLASAMNNLLTTLSKAPVVSRNVIDLTNALANLSNQGARVGTATRTMNRAMNSFTSTSNRMSKSALSLASAFGKFYATYFLAIRGVKKLWEGVQSSMDYVETYNYFKVTFDKINREFTDIGAEGATNYVNGFQGQIEELLTKMTGYQLGANGELFSTGNVGLGLDPKQLMQFQAKIGAVTNSVGLIGQTSVDASKALSMLVADISSLTNTSIDTVMTNLSSGLIGQSRALYKYGIDITNNTLQQYALAEGIEKSVSEMTQSEKMQLRLIAILDQSKVAWGDMANTISSCANQYRVFEQQSANLGRTFGNLLLPMVQNLLPYLNGLVIAMNNVLTTFGFKLHGDNWLSDLNDGTSNGAGAIEEIEDALNEADESATKLKQNLMGFDELNVINSSKTNQGLTEIGDVDLSQSIHNALLDYEKVWDDAIKESNNKAQELAKVIETNINTFIGDLPDKFIKLGDSITKFGDSVSPFGEGFGQGLSSFLKISSGISFETIAGGLDLIGGAMNKIDPVIIESAGSALGGFIGALAVGKITETGFDLFTSGVSKIAEALSNPILTGFALAAGIVSLMDYLFNNATGDNGEFSQAVVDSISKFADSIKKVSDGQKTLKDSFTDIDTKAEKVKTALDDYFSLLNDDSIDFTDKQTQLQNYVNYITTAFPELKQYVDEHTGLFTVNKDVILDNVKALNEYAKAQAMTNYTSKAYEDLFDLKKSYQDYVKELETYEQEFRNKFVTVDMYGNELLKPGSRAWEAHKKLEEMQNQATEFENAIKAQEEFISKLEKGDTSSLFGTEAKDNVKSYKDSVETATKEIEQNVKNMSTNTKEAISSMGKGFVDEMQSAISKGSLYVKSFGTDIERMAESSISNIKKVAEEISKTKADFPVLSTTGKPFLPQLPQYSTGGFPEDGLFYANHNEIVGKFSNGQTAVANNEQITSGIADAVYPAVYNAMMNAFNNSNNGNLSVQIDGREVFKATRKYASEYQRTTGNQAFSF